MPETYGISTYGKAYVINEGFDERPPLRILYIFINIILFVGPLIMLVRSYVGLRTNLHQRRKSSGLLTSVFVAVTVNNILRNSHMIDHICRPIYYHEPKWAYQKYIVTTMELATYANIFVATVAHFGMTKLLKMIESGTRKGLPSTFALMVLYVANSLFNLVHYTIEPPWNYGPFPNFNIAGTAITNIPIVLLLIHIYNNHPDVMGSGGGKEQLLVSEETVTGRTTRSSARRRSRSKTPVRK